MKAGKAEKERRRSKNYGDVDEQSSPDESLFDHEEDRIGRIDPHFRDIVQKGLPLFNSHAQQRATRS